MRAFLRSTRQLCGCVASHEAAKARCACLLGCLVSYRPLARDVLLGGFNKRISLSRPLRDYSHILINTRYGFELKSLAFYRLS